MCREWWGWDGIGGGGGLPGERGSAGGVWADYVYSDPWSNDSNLPAVPKNLPNVSGGFWEFPRFLRWKFLFLATPGHSQHGRADEYPPVPGNPSCVSNLLRSTSLCPIRLADHFPSHTPSVGRTLPKAKGKRNSDSLLQERLLFHLLPILPLHPHLLLRLQPHNLRPLLHNQHIEISPLLPHSRLFLPVP